MPQKTESSTTIFTLSLNNQVGNNGAHAKISFPLIKSRTSTGLKDYATLIRNGGDATTALTAMTETVPSFQYNSIDCDRIGDKLNFKWDCCATAYLANTVGNRVSLNARSEATAKARSAARSYFGERLTPLNGQAFTGELRESIDTLRDPAAGMREVFYAFVQDYRRASTRYKRSPRELVKALANLWLQFRFAVLPIIGDTKAILDIITQNMEKENHIKKRFYGYSEYSTTSIDHGYGFGLSAIKASLETTTVWRAECFIHLGAAMVHTDNLATILNTKDDFLNEDNIPGTIWELTPFSWLWDYFINIGSILESSAISTAGVAYVSESNVETLTRSTNVSNFRYSGLTGPNGYLVKSLVDRGAHMVFKRRAVYRATGTLGIPPMYFSLPGSGIKLTNIAALIASLKL